VADNSHAETEIKISVQIKRYFFAILLHRKPNMLLASVFSRFKNCFKRYQFCVFANRKQI